MKFVFLLVVLNLGLAVQSAQAKSFYGVFGDVTVIDQNNQKLDEKSVAGLLDFFLAHEFSEKFSGLFEFVYDDSIAHLEKHVERFSLKYEFDPAFYLALGRFHTPLGNINRTQHHGSLLRDTITRPFFLEYHETQILFPLHVVGIMAGGQVYTESLNYAYETTLHSDHTIEVETNHEGLRHLEIEPNDSLSGAISPGYSLRIRAFPDQKDWELAGFIYRNEADFGTANHLDESIAGIDLEYRSGHWKFNAEFFWVGHRVNDSGRKYNATAYFLQTGYRINEVTSLHYRFAEMDVDPSDPYYAWTTLLQQHRNTLALRYDLNEKHALKLELERQSFSGLSAPDVSTIRAQWSFLFQ